MVSEYQLMENAYTVGYEFETTCGVDPEGLNGGRFDWIGQVIDRTFNEEIDKESRQPLGTGPGPFFTPKKKQSFEMEVTSFASIPFSVITANELLSAAFGTISGTTGVVTQARPLRSLTVETGYSDANATYFLLLTGGKVNTVQFAWRPDELNMLTMSLMFSTRTRSTTVVDCNANGGTDLDALGVRTDDPSHGSDVTFTLQDVPAGTAIDPNILEFDLTITNNLEFVWADNGSYNPAYIKEGKFRVNWTMKTAKFDDDNSLTSPSNIFQADSGDASLIDLLVVANQTAGWYMSYDMPTCVLLTLESTFNEDTACVEETFSAVQQGTFVLDMNLAA